MSNAIIVGCGRVGSKLANRMSSAGHNVCVIDRRAEAFAELGTGFSGTTAQGSGLDEAVLVSAGIEDCDILAAVTEQDTANLMAAEIASRLYEVPHVIVRLYNPAHERAYTQLGIDYVCGTSMVADELFDKISSGHGSHIETIGEYELIRFSLDLSATEETSILARDLEREREVRIVAFERRDGSASSIPTKDTRLHHGDLVVACVRQDLVGNFAKYIQE